MTKTVALSDGAYDALARIKRPGQSFSELVKELVAERRPSVRDVGGALAADSRYWRDFAARRRRVRAASRGRAKLR